MRFDVVECGIRIRTLREDLHYTQTQFVSASRDPVLDNRKKDRLKPVP